MSHALTRRPPTFVLFLIVYGLALGPLFAVAVFGEEKTYSDQIENLYSELSLRYGYSEIRDYNDAGTLIEFRSNGTIPTYEDTIYDLVRSYGFYIVEYSPAPPITEDSIILISTIKGVSR